MNENLSVKNFLHMNLMEISNLIQDYIDLNVKSALPKDDIDFDNIMKNQNLLSYVNDEIELNEIAYKIESKLNEFQIFIQNFSNIEMMFLSLRNYYLSLKMDSHNNEKQNQQIDDTNVEVINQEETNENIFEPRDYTNNPQILSKEIPNNGDLYGSEFLRR